MPECQAYGCKNKPQDCKDKTFFKIPDPTKNPNVASQAADWLHFIGTGFTVDTFKFGPYKVMCEDHFTPNLFTIDLHIKMCRAQNKEPRYNKVLVPGAVPTVFVHRPAKADDGRDERLQKRTEEKQKQVGDK